MIHRIKIPDWRPTRDNELLNCHWRIKHKRKTDDAAMVMMYAIVANVMPATGKRRVSLEIVLKGRQKTTDEWAYHKSLMDALVKCRMLVDDSPQFVAWGGTTYSRGGEAGTTIILEDMEP